MLSDHLTPEVLDALARGGTALVATSTADGVPNVAPKGTLRVIDPYTLVYAEIHPGKTTANIEQNPSVAVAVLDPVTMAWYQVKGYAERDASGRLFRQVCDEVAGLPVRLPPPKAAVIIHVKEVYDLSPGRAQAIHVILSNRE